MKIIAGKSSYHQWFKLNFMKRREYFLYAKKIKITFFSTIRLLSVSPRHRSAIFGYYSSNTSSVRIHLNTRMCYFLSNQSINTCRICFLAFWGKIALWWRGETEMRLIVAKKLFFIFFAYKMYSQRFIKFRLNHDGRWTSPVILFWTSTMLFTWQSKGQWQASWFLSKIS